MRILQINSVCGVGSTGRIATDIHDVLVKQGHESYISYGRGLPNKCDSAIKIGTKYDNYVHVAKTRLFDRHGFASKRATKELIVKVKQLNPDVIHLHNIHGYYINVELLFEFIKETNKPVVWTLHDCWAFTGHCAYFDFIGCNCWRLEGSHICSQKRSYPKSIFINNSRNNFLRKSKAFTGVNNLTIATPSKWLADLVKESFLKGYPVEVINNGIDLEIFQPQAQNNPFREKYDLMNKFIILGVASVWNRRKGFKYFIELSNHLKNDEVIVLVGISEKQKKDLPKNIIGITRTNNVKELAEIYSSADVFVNPTLEDNFPTTNIEALACGTPVITFNTGGSVESVINGECGFIVEQGNTEELYYFINEIRKNGKASYFEKCLKQATEHYNKNDRYSEYIKLYSKIKSRN